MEGFSETLSKEVRPEWNSKFFFVCLYFSVLMGVKRIADEEKTIVHFCLIEPGGVKTNYATTSTVPIAVHPAYAAEDTPARVLERYMNDPANRETWAEADDVAAAMYRIVARGQKIPLRLPLGPDAWGMMKAEFAVMEKALEEYKEISLGLGTKEQLGAVEFLKTLNRVDG
jgi:hypothetical protein